jgi:hypothetical protein
MKHFHRTHVMPDAVLAAADAFFPTIGLQAVGSAHRARTFRGVVGTPEITETLVLTVKMEGGHYTFVEAETTAQGESRLDRNVKKFFVQLHKQVDHRHASSAAY